MVLTSKGLLGTSCILVIVVAGVERFTFKGIQSNLVTYLTEVMKMSTATAVKTCNVWFGVSYSLPVIGAFLADSFSDRYSTLTYSGLLYVSGLVALSSTAFVWDTTSKIRIRHGHEGASSTTSRTSTCLLFLSLLLVALGQSGYNPCLQAFGADQLQLTDDASHQKQLPSSNSTEDGDENDEIPSNDTKKSCFFKWYYFSVCSGTLLGVTLLSYLQEILGWGIGYAVPTISMALSVAPFLCGKRFYIVIKKPKSAGGNTKPMIKTLVKSIKGTALKLVNRNHKTLPSNTSIVVELKLQQEKGCSQDLDDQQGDITNVISADVLVDEPLEENQKSLRRLIPIWVMLLVFSIVLQQPTTFFTKQGLGMKRNFGSHFVVPSASLQGAKSITIILLVPVYDKIVAPIYRIITRSEKGISVMQRMGFGLFLSGVAMSVAAVVEKQRLNISRREPDISSAQLSIFWLLPQYIIMGMSECFTIVGMQEFFYSEVPNKLKTLGMALPNGVFGAGSFLGAILISIVDKATRGSDGKHSWFSDDVKESQLYKYYWLLAFSSAVSLLCFAVYSRKFYH